MVREKIGDLLCDANIIIHSANCFCNFGAGVARAIREKYPEAYEADCNTIKGDKLKLGTFSAAKTKDGKFVLNLYGQYHYGAGKKQTSYDALHNGFSAIKSKLDLMSSLDNVVVGIPYGLGSGLGGARWPVVRAIINSIFADSKIDVVIVRLPNTPEMK